VADAANHQAFKRVNEIERLIYKSWVVKGSAACIHSLETKQGLVICLSTPTNCVSDMYDSDIMTAFEARIVSAVSTAL
jgi:hypothetical protein